VDVHGGPREGGGHVAHPAGVVEVDVGDDDGGEGVGAHAELVEGGQQGGDRGLAAGLDQNGRRAVDQVAGGQPVPAAEAGVDLDDPGGDLAGVGAAQPMS
jgi:hypothetical protein